MQIINLYHYTDGETNIVTPNRRSETDEVYKYRLVADEGFIITDGENEYVCIDVAIDDVDKYEEVEGGEEND